MGIINNGNNGNNGNINNTNTNIEVIEEKPSSVTGRNKKVKVSATT